ncbi:MAG TPA: hypothetical protein VJU78_02790, partial [Chitinophagaceae bacterium]|nr:hypothetical protein [Chitinophagaceae bacterium]
MNQDGANEENSLHQENKSIDVVCFQNWPGNLNLPKNRDMKNITIFLFSILIVSCGNGKENIYTGST